MTQAAGAAGAVGVAVVAGKALRLSIASGEAAASTPANPARVHDDLPPATDAQVAKFLGPIQPGLRLGAWTIAATYGVYRGALPFILTNDRGQRLQVDLMATDASSPDGVAATDRGQLYVINSGRGDQFTPRDVEHSVHRLARLLRERERARAVSFTSFRQRHARYPDGIFVVPA